MSSHAVVKGIEKGGRPWKEAVGIVGFSATGASFSIPRRCEVGTVVSLMIPLPVHMRYYDYDKDLYRVWGLVQHCQRMTEDASSAYHVGVAFIGRHAPQSYKANAMQYYRICGVDDSGMWTVEESGTPFKKRGDVRFWKPVDLYLALIEKKDGKRAGERTVAENVSRSGAAVFTTLKVGIGDRVKFICEEYDFSGLAVVCNVQTGDDERIRLHLNFVERCFPVESIMKGEMVAEHV